MAGNVKVTVTEGYAVAVDGKQHGGGQTVNVDRDTADHWIASGWAKPAKATVKPAKPAKATVKPAAKTPKPNTGRQRRRETSTP